MVGVVSMACLPWVPDLLVTCFVLLASMCLALIDARLRFMAWVIVGATYTQAWLAWQLPDIADSGDERWLIRGTVLEPPQINQFQPNLRRQRFVLQPVGEPGCKLLLNYYGPITLRAGMGLQLEARIKPPRGLANWHSFDAGLWQRRSGLCGSGYVGRTALQALPLLDVRLSPLASWRESVEQDLRRLNLSAPALGLVRALLLGQRDSIELAHMAIIRELGLSHLFVVSGLHIGLAAMLGWWIGFALARLRGMDARYPLSIHLPKLLALLLATFYAALTGFGLPAQRALVMLLVLQLAAFWFRTMPGYRGLLMALCAVLMLDPLSVYSPGFWLSFVAVALLMFCAHHWRGLSALQLVLRLQVILSMALGVLAGYWFGGFSMLAPVANLVVIPVFSLLLVPTALLMAVSLMLTSSAPPVLPLLFELLTLVLQQLLAYREDISRAWMVLQPTAASLFMALTGVLLLWLLPRVRSLVLMLILLLPLFGNARLKDLEEGEYHLELLDVGQGLSVWIQGRGVQLVYDTGGGEPDGFNMAPAVVLPALRADGVDQLQHLLISHGDRDHASGLSAMLETLQIDAIWQGPDVPLRDRRQKVCQRGMSWQRGTFSMSVLAPGRTHAEVSDNDGSCVLMLDLAGFRVLLPGDIGRQTELDLVRSQAGDLMADVLVMPHHGSISSSSGPFLRSVAPALAIATAGFRNRFNHPDPRVVAA